jgi:hypothetical protein
VFSDRAWGWKFAAALALVAGSGVLSYVRGRDLNPAYWECLVHPERHDGRTIWIPGAVVKQVGPSGILIGVDRFDVVVRGKADVAPGSPVSVRGVFRAEDGRIDLVAWRRMGPLHRSRWIVELVSLLVVAVVARNFLKHFAFRRERLQVEVGP